MERKGLCYLEQLQWLYIVALGNCQGGFTEEAILELRFERCMCVLMWSPITFTEQLLCSRLCARVLRALSHLTLTATLWSHSVSSYLPYLCKYCWHDSRMDLPCHPPVTAQREKCWWLEPWTAQALNVVTLVPTTAWWAE